MLSALIFIFPRKIKISSASVVNQAKVLCNPNEAYGVFNKMPLSDVKEHNYDTVTFKNTNTV